MKGFLVPRRTYDRFRGVTQSDASKASWQKSTLSNLNGNCVEVGLLRPGRIGVRDTKDHDTGTILVFTASEWNAFLTDAKEGRFDIY
jgi:hypothetical protein